MKHVGQRKATFMYTELHLTCWFAPKAFNEYLICLEWRDRSVCFQGVWE